MGPSIKGTARQPAALLVLAMILLVGILVGMSAQSAAHKRVASSAGRLRQVTFERLPGYQSGSLVIDTIIASDTGALFRTTTTMSPNGTKTAVSARTMSEADFQQLRALINESHFFEIGPQGLVPHAPSLRISALRADRQHSVETTDGFALAPQQLRAIVSLFDRLAAPISPADVDTASAK